MTPTRMLIDPAELEPYTPRYGSRHEERRTIGVLRSDQERLKILADRMGLSYAVLITTILNYLEDNGE